MSALILGIEEDFKGALKSKDEIKISTLRLLKSSIHNLEIEKRHSLLDEEVWQLISQEIKQRKEGIEQYKKAQRGDLVQSAEKEIKILSSYLPPQLSNSKLTDIIREAIKKTNATSMTDLGGVMKDVMLTTKGRVEGSKVIAIVRKELEKR